MLLPLLAWEPVAQAPWLAATGPGGCRDKAAAAAPGTQVAAWQAAPPVAAAEAPGALPAAHHALIQSATGAAAPWKPTLSHALMDATAALCAPPVAQALMETAPRAPPAMGLARVPPSCERGLTLRRSMISGCAANRMTARRAWARGPATPDAPARTAKA